MSNIFISYDRESKPLVMTLSVDIRALGHAVWFDQELTGGRSWWDQILEQVRNCDVFVFALAPGALDSEACKLEYEYADALGKTILPVLIAEGVSTNLLPGTLSKIQFVDYRQQDKTALARVGKAIRDARSPKPLPDPLPKSPEVPISYLSSLAARIAAPRLSQEEQILLVSDLKEANLHDPINARDARQLVKKLRQRRDLLGRTERELDALLSIAPPTESPSPTPLEAERPELRGFTRLRAFVAAQFPVIGVCVLLAIVIGRMVLSGPEAQPEPVSEVAAESEPTSDTESPTGDEAEPVGAPAGTVILNGLMWTLEDNGLDVAWEAAARHCREVTLGGYTDWSLAAINQLESVYAPDVGYAPRGLSTPVHIKDPIQLTGFFVWSSDRRGSDAAWGLYFSGGDQDSYPISSSRGLRALCVRGPDE